MIVTRENDVVNVLREGYEEVKQRFRIREIYNSHTNQKRSSVKYYLFEYEENIYYLSILTI